MSAAVGERAPVWRLGEDPAPVRDLLRRGGVLAIPTESSYGLAADPASAEGVANIFRIKGRPGGKPLPVVIADETALPLLGIDPTTAEARWLSARWPAPLSGLLPTTDPLPAAAGTGKLAVRVPAYEPLRQLLAQLGMALTATSANQSGEPPILDPDELTTWLADEEALVVDGGPLAGGPPSTLVTFEGDQIMVIRPGAYTVEMAAVLQG